jgi:hypothetical protein
MSNPTESSYISSIAELVEFLHQYEQDNSPFSKEAIADAVKNHFVLLQNRSVYYTTTLQSVFLLQVVPLFQILC